MNIANAAKTGTSSMWVQEGLICDHLRRTHERGAMLEFDRERKLMSVMATRGSRNLLFVKGAPESVVRRCTHAIDEAGAHLHHFLRHCTSLCDPHHLGLCLQVLTV